MKIKVAVIAAMLLSAIAVAQPFAAQDTADKASMNTMATQANFRISELLDTTVKEQGGGDVGQIEDILIDSQGRANYAVLAGPYNKLYPIPMQALNQREEDGDFFINITKDRLDNAPSFSKDEWQQLTALDWEQEVMGYYGEQSQSETAHKPRMQQEQIQREQQRQQRATDQQQTEQ